MKTRANETLCILKHARELLVRCGMSIGHTARNANGGPTGPLSVSAVCWCPYGSVRRACFDLGIGESFAPNAHHALEQVARRLFPGALGQWKYRYIAVHESTKGERTLRMLDEAIAELETKP